MTFVAALRHDRVEAPWFLDGPINGERFRLYVEKVLVRTLKPGDLVVMDNLGSHKGKAVRAASRAAGAKLFFPPAGCAIGEPPGREAGKLTDRREAGAFSRLIATSDKPSSCLIVSTTRLMTGAIGERKTKRRTQNSNSIPG